MKMNMNRKCNTARRVVAGCPAPVEEAGLNDCQFGTEELVLAVAVAAPDFVQARAST